jgi:hypothetical protein
VTARLVRGPQPGGDQAMRVAEREAVAQRSRHERNVLIADGRVEH